LERFQKKWRRRDRGDLLTALMRFDSDNIKRDEEEKEEGCDHEDHNPILRIARIMTCVREQRTSGWS
jgi:hypothetical protein